MDPKIMLALIDKALINAMVHYFIINLEKKDEQGNSANFLEGLSNCLLDPTIHWETYYSPNVCNTMQ